MFVWGGYVNPGYYLYNAGYYGYYWSSVGYNSYLAYGLYFTPYGVSPSNINDRYGGQSVRCVALGGWVRHKL